MRFFITHQQFFYYWNVLVKNFLLHECGKQWENKKKVPAASIFSFPISNGWFLLMSLLCGKSLFSILTSVQPIHHQHHHRNSSAWRIKKGYSLALKFTITKQKIDEKLRISVRSCINIMTKVRSKMVRDSDLRLSELLKFDIRIFNMIFIFLLYYFFLSKTYFLRYFNKCMMKNVFFHHTKIF